MGVVLRYRGRALDAAEVACIADLIAAHPEASRRALSQALCTAWGWTQPNGTLCDAVCRGLLLALERAGHIRLPPPRWRSPRPRRRHILGEREEVDTSPLVAPLQAIGSLEFRQVRRTPQEPLFHALLDRYHDLGYAQPVGEHLKYVVFADTRPVACFAWSSAPRHLGPRDRYLGWSTEARRHNLRLIAYNSRFLILPWVRVPSLASHLLGRMTRRLPAEWARMYGHPVYFAETFVDPTRVAGTCYRAANWVSLGLTTGRGNNDQTGRPTRSCKEVLGLPLVRDFRERLGRLA